MSTLKHVRYQPVKDLESYTEKYREQEQNRQSTFRWCSSWQSLLLITSLILNASTVLYYQTTRGSSDGKSQRAGKAIQQPSYAGLPYDSENTFHYYNEYWGGNESDSDAVWDAIATEPLVVALSAEEIDEMDLPPSIPFPWDKDRSLYYLQSFHMLHCLKAMRRGFLDRDLGQPSLIKQKHVYHCLDLLRSYISCQADDTPMPARLQDPAIGDGMVMQCRSMNRLADWAREGRRDACFRMVNDFKQVDHNLEKYQFCPENSPYYSTMTAYFERYGHEAMFKEPQELTTVL